MESFRQEIIETQKTRSDLLKWKLIISASLGAIGLSVNPLNSSSPGVSNYDSPVDLAFCLIPFVCTYVDLLCYHLNLRMFVISKFFQRLQTNKPNKNQDKEWESWQDIYLFRKYEETCTELRSAFSLESLALKWSTIILSLIVIVISYYAQTEPTNDALWLVLAGAFGVVAAWLNQIAYDNKTKALFEKELSPIFFKNQLTLEVYSNHCSSSRYEKNKWAKNLYNYFINVLKNLYKYFINILKNLYFLISLTVFLIGFGLLILYVIKSEKGDYEGILFIFSGVLLIFASALIENFFYRNKTNQSHKSINNIDKNFPWSNKEDLWLGTLLIIFIRFYFSTECFSLITREPSCKYEIIKINKLTLYVDKISNNIVAFLTWISIGLVLYICFLLIKDIGELQ